MRVVNINVTKMRESVFELMDDLLNDKSDKIRIRKKGYSDVIVMQKEKKNKKISSADARKFVKATHGALPNYGFKKSEMELARKHFVQNYK